MIIKWLVQDVFIQNKQIQRKINALFLLGYDASAIGTIKNYPYISGIKEASNKNVINIPLCGTKVLNIINKAKSDKDLSDECDDGNELLLNLKKGVFSHETTFDQHYYKDLGLPLLNSESTSIPIKEHLNTKFERDMFLKPSRDLKAFTGAIIKKGTSIKTFIEERQHQSFYIDEMAIIAEVQDIKNEYRFFVIDGEPITGSAYLIDGIAKESEFIPDEIWNKAKEYSTLYEPSDVFVLDLALLQNGEIKIVEYNCFNVSGVYLCDLELFYKKLNDYILLKNNKELK